MEIIRGNYNLKSKHRGSVVTIGNFDGVHKGHQAVINRLNKQAQHLSVPACVITFEPLPHEYFAHQKETTRLTRFREKARLFEKLGIDLLVILRFCRKLADLPPETFVDDILHQGLGTQHLIVGDDFRFGKQRTGDFAFLQQAGAQYGFGVESTQTYQMDGQRVSSTRIRALLEKADFKNAATLLGRPFSISGRVTYGNQLGRTLGFPTANIALKHRNVPFRGVFAVHVVDEQKTVYEGMANIGTRPTIGGEKQLLETHLFNCQHDLYDQHLEIVFRHKIREERNFKGLNELSDALRQDKQDALEFFKKHHFKASPHK